MIDQRDIEELVREFKENPGAESERLEFKSKEILDTTGSRKKLVRILSALANRSGGTIVIGVRREESDLRLQSFNAEREVRQNLTNIAQQYTNPSLTPLWDIEFTDCLGSTLLRIDVEAAEADLIRFDYDGEYQPWIRDEDGMRELTTEEAIEFYDRKEKRSTGNQLIERTEHLDFEPDPINTRSIEAEFPNRGVTQIDSNYTVVFGSGILQDRIGKSIHYKLDQNLNSNNGYSEIIRLLESANENINASLDWDLGYAIRVGDTEIVSCSIESLRTDLERLGKIAKYLDQASSEAWNYGPTIAGYTKCKYGILWFEAQQESKTFTRGTYGLILPDIPFDKSDIRSFYDDMGQSPSFYNHESGLNYIHFNGHGLGPLCSPVPKRITDDDDYLSHHIMADNPLYEWPEMLEDELDDPIPSRLSDGISTVSRIPFQVSGGYIEEDPDEFSLNYLSYTQVLGTHPTILVDNSCWQSNPNPELTYPE